MENCIYRFLDINKKLLYIGKAKHLEERVLISMLKPLG